MSDQERLKSIEAANGVLANLCIELNTQNARLKSDYISLDATIVRGAFKIGQHVQKTTGYKFPGVVIGIAKKLDGRTLYLVECTAAGAEGVCHIYGESNLEFIPLPDTIDFGD